MTPSQHIPAAPGHHALPAPRPGDEEQQLILRAAQRVPDFQHLRPYRFLAARALGYGGLWRSGSLMYDRGFHRELELGEDEQIVGFLYLGTPQHAEETTNEAVPDLHDILR